MELLKPQPNMKQLESLAVKLDTINLQSRQIISSNRADRIEILQGYRTAKKRLFAYLYDVLGLTHDEWRNIFNKAMIKKQL